MRHVNADEVWSRLDDGIRRLTIDPEWRDVTRDRGTLQTEQTGGMEAGQHEGRRTPDRSSESRTTGRHGDLASDEPIRGRAAQARQRTGRSVSDQTETLCHARAGIGTDDAPEPASVKTRGEYQARGQTRGTRRPG